MMLSVIIITKNEAAHIDACLGALSWADEIIVLDSGSEDATVQICKNHTDKVFETDWPGFGVQKQRALNKATGDWVLSIDADEIVSEQLKNEILKAISNADVDGFLVPRLSSYCGKQIHHGGWWPDYTPRLFHRERGRFTEATVHERIVVEGKLGTLQNPLLHDAFVDLEEVLVKLNSYSSLGAEMQFNQGKKSSLVKAVARGFWTFIRTYLIKGAILDGGHGLMLAISNAEGTYYKYAKLWLKQQNK